MQVGGEVIWQCSRNLALGLRLLSSMWEGALVSAEQLKDMDQIVAYVPSAETRSTVTPWF